MRSKFPVKITEIFPLGGWISLVYTLEVAVGVSKSWAAISAVSLFAIFLLGLSNHRVWNEDKSRFQLTDFKKGQVAYKNFEDADQSIFVTHFTCATPEEMYVARMLAQMEKGVTVTRLLPARNRSQPWLDRFRGQLRYTEFTTATNELPFDILIVDRKRVVLSLPTNQSDMEFGQAMIMNNPEVAQVFIGIFEKMCKDGKASSVGKAGSNAARAGRA